MTRSKTTVGESALGRVAARAFRFLVALARNPRVMAQLRARGFTAQVQAEGWALVDRVAGRGTEVPVEAYPPDESVERAIERIDAWVTTNVPVMKAALQRHYPAQFTFLFADGLGVAHGPDAVRVAATLVARFGTLASSPERAATRDDDRAALALLATRGVTDDDRARLAARVTSVQRAAVAQADEVDGDVARSLPPPADDPRAALHAWFSEWSEIARAVVPRRADQIRLGLASPRRTRAGARSEDDADEEDVAADDEEKDDAEAAAPPEPPAPAKRAPAKAPAKSPARPRAGGAPSSAPSPA
ncbi:MAG: hypothetical protein U0324_22450 [Polyangiales bacterium]